MDSNDPNLPQMSNVKSDPILYHTLHDPILYTNGGYLWEGKLLIDFQWCEKKDRAISGPVFSRI
jgi:hypothetical protein